VGRGQRGCSYVTERQGITVCCDRERHLPHGGPGSGM